MRSLPATPGSSPWPDTPSCPKCGKPVTTTKLRRIGDGSFCREISHLDRSPACVIEADAPASRPKRVAFLSLGDAETWAELWARDGYTVYLGYVRDANGDRKIGILKGEDGASWVVEPGPDGSPVRRSITR